MAISPAEFQSRDSETVRKLRSKSKKSRTALEVAEIHVDIALAEGKFEIVDIEGTQQGHSNDGLAKQPIGYKAYFGYKVPTKAVDLVCGKYVDAGWQLVRSGKDATGNQYIILSNYSA